MITTKPSKRVAEILGRPGSDVVREPITPALKREILRCVAAMGLPSMVSFLLLTVYDLIDVFWLARLGEEPVAAVTLFAAFLWVLSFPNNVVGTGSVAVISRRFGERDARGTELAIKNTFAAKFLIGLGAGAIGIPIMPAALTFLGAEPAVRGLGVRYGIIQCLVLGVSLASFSVYTALRSVGRPALGMWVSVAGTLVNLALDPLLIFGVGPFPELGVVGASLASALGFATVTACGMLALGSPHSPVPVRWLARPRVDMREGLRMLRIGLPAGAGALSFSLSESMIVKLVAIYGTRTIALFGMSLKVLHFGVMVIVGLGLGTSALIGQFLGSRHLLRAWLAAVITMQLGAASLAAFGLAVAIAAVPLVGVFFDTPEMIDPGVRYLRLLVLGLPFAGLSIGSEQAYAGAGRNTPSMLLQAATAWLLTIPLMYALGEGLGLGPSGMMAGSSLGNFLGGLLGVALVRHGGWLEHRV